MNCLKYFIINTEDIRYIRDDYVIIEFRVIVNNIFRFSW